MSMTGEWQILFASRPHILPLSRIYSIYSMEAQKLKKLSQTVLNYYNKDNLNFTLQVSETLSRFRFRLSPVHSSSVMRVLSERV